MMTEKNANSIKNAEGVESLKSLVRQASLGRLEYYGKIDQVQMLEIDNETDLSFDHWVCSIHISVETLKIAFKAHFTTKTARALAATSLGEEKRAQTLLPKTCHDFMGEYANLTAGLIKTQLEACLSEDPDEEKKESMLPLKEPGFDTVNIMDELASNRVVDAWQLRWHSLGNEHSIICGLIITAGDKQALKKIKQAETSTVSVDDDGDVEFF